MSVVQITMSKPEGTCFVAEKVWSGFEMVLPVVATTLDVTEKSFSAWKSVKSETEKTVSAREQVVDEAGNPVSKRALGNRD